MHERRQLDARDVRAAATRSGARAS
jgi:hypothetical protein